MVRDGPAPAIISEDVYEELNHTLEMLQRGRTRSLGPCWGWRGP